jgi:phosphatidylinositol-3-phosphatase
MRRRHLIAALLGILTLGTVTTSIAAGPCGTNRHRPRRWEHVVWIWFENHSYDQIIDSASAAFINGLASQCGSAANFHNLTHVSLGNYIGAVTGLDNASLQPFILDCSPSASCETSATSIFQQVPSWKAYMESMTTNCQPTGVVGYAVRHNPPPYLTALAGSCPLFDVPYTELQTDLDHDTLPSFAFITPNTVNDGHDGGDPVSIQNSDAWLAANLPQILNSAAYQRGTTAVFITWDEGEGPITPGFLGKDCSTNTTDEDCHIPAIVVSPSTRPGTVSSKLFNHYSLLRTTEEMLHLKHRNFPGLAKKARSMRSAFHL